MAQVICRYCNETVIRSNRGQVTCGGEECKAKRRDDYKREWIKRPKQRQKARERNAKWCEENRGVRSRNPWLMGPPPYDDHLPGGACLLQIDRMRPVPIEKLSQLHGLVTNVLGEPHEQDPGFSLIPWNGGIGWAVYSPNLSLTAAPRARDGRLGGAGVTVRLGPYARLKAPPAGKRGHQRVRVSTITPVVITTMGRTRFCRTPTADNIVSTLRYSLASRVGVDVRTEDIPMQFVDANTQPAEVNVGGKFGWLRGWMGDLDIETNAVGRWLLECAGRGLGLGGRTALGCGRVRVTVS